MTTNYRDEAFPPMQRMANKALTASQQEVPCAVLFAEADVTAWFEISSSAPSSTSFTDRLIKLVADTVALHPTFNAVFADGLRRTFDTVDIGLAVAGADGTLSIPVIRNACELDLAQITETRRTLQERARAKRLRPEDMNGTALTISNISASRSARFAVPIIPYGQGSILVVSAARPVRDYDGGSRRIVSLSFAFDHRVNNGMPAAAFLDDLVDAIESADLSGTTPTA